VRQVNSSLRQSKLITDNTSPAHYLFRIYDEVKGCPIDPIGCVLFTVEIYQHSKRESEPTEAEFNQAIDIVRREYAKVYGPKALQNAMGRWANWLIYLTPINGIIDAGDLGTVTVRSDGNEEYEGPPKPERKDRKKKK